MISNRRAFTLVELLVVVAMIALLVGSISVSVTGANARARVERARAEVKVISQAILSYENWDKGGGEYKLPTLANAEVSKSTVGFLLGTGTANGQQIPATLMAELRGGGKMRDPWGNPYRISIREGKLAVAGDNTTYATGYYLPNWYRLSEEER